VVRPLGAEGETGDLQPLHRCSRNGSRAGRRRSWRLPGQEADRTAGTGKSGGFRTLVATNKGNRWVFLFGFSKNERSNIDKDEAEALKKLAAHVLSLTAQAIGKAERAGELIEVDCDAEDQVSHS
jgi:hypothetical protein